MRKRNFIKTASLLVAATLAVPSLGLAQTNAAPAADQAKVQALAKDYQATATKLASIREATYEANPDLAEQRDAFQAMIEKRMADNGFDADAKLERMQEIATQIKDEDLAEAKKQALVKEFQQARQKMLSAQRDVLSEPDVQQAGEALQEDTLAAMKEQNKTTSGLLERLARLRQDLQAANTNG